MSDTLMTANDFAAIRIGLEGGDAEVGFVAKGYGATEDGAWNEFISDICVKFEAEKKRKYWRRIPTMEVICSFSSDVKTYRYVARIAAFDGPCEGCELAALGGIEQYRRQK